jgi:indolepyruvate ferredoxin oxidoreductase
VVGVIASFARAPAPYIGLQAGASPTEIKEVVMNAPLPAEVMRALATLSLDDKYALARWRAFMSGIQALVRLPILQHTRDTMAGLNTAGFISGYRGSPLGGYDQALWQAKEHLAAHHVVFQPGVNEELGATAVWGTQQLDLYPDKNKFDGVFGLWYGKGPGVDRCSDVFKHANMAGTAKHGGVVAVAGDDHVAKSSSVAHQSDHIFKACGLPVFFPANVQEILDFGLHAFALSRFSGLWASLKAIQEIVESSSSVLVDPDRVRIVLPEDFVMPPGGLHIRWPDSPLEQEARLMDFKWYAALAYIRANRLNRTIIDSAQARLGLIASGKAYNDTRQALHDLGLDDLTCARIGIRLHKVGVVWPLEANITREFATGLQEILVIEEKRQMIEYQLKEELYNWREDVRPNVLGKFSDADGDRSGGEWAQPNPAGNWLLRAKADLNPAIIAKAIAQRLDRLGLLAQLGSDLRARIRQRLDVIDAKERGQQTLKLAASDERAPWFCSGCPHNTSTKVPEGSRAMAGIGCHYMVVWMDRATTTFTQMGGEGVPWVGQAPFTTEPHVFANLGDGTYFHSGVLAVRQSIAAKVNITYKILFNDAVAMTGGQPVDGTLRVPELTRELQAEGVQRIAIVTDDPDKYRVPLDLASGVTIHHRDALDAVQREMRDVPGCSVIIYEQTCATEKRRRIKRGKLPAQTQRVVINEAVCEGCGDCSVQSNCLSVEPVETEFGRKRRINQHTCNQDFSCVKGFCPSFVTVDGAKLRSTTHAPQQTQRPDPFALPELPEPDSTLAHHAYGIVVAGIGGTGVITIGQLLGMAAHIEGKGIVTQDSAGLAQKGGATWSHIQIADNPEAIHTTRVATAEADLVIGCDPIVTAQAATLTTMDAGRTRVALNTHATPTAAFVRDGGWQFPAAHCDSVIDAAARPGEVSRLDANQLATQLLGDSLYANPLMLGFAWQKGWVPLSRQALLRAIELNGVQVANNLAAFEWGRRAAHDLAAVMRLAVPAQTVRFMKPAVPQEDLAELIRQRVADLTAYQDAAYARQYLGYVERVREAEQHFGSTRLAETVARNLYKLMAYKDEYEVARLLTDPAFEQGLAEQFEAVPGQTLRVSYNLAPPAWAALLGGTAGKHRFGPWLRPGLRLLARLKFLRGTHFDPFGRTRERRTERSLAREYRASLNVVLRSLNAGNLPQAIEIARIPEDIRGYGPIKERNLQAACEKWALLMKDWAERELVAMSS